MTSVILRPSIQLIVEIGTNNMIPFLDILVSWKGSVLTIPVYRNLRTLATTSTTDLIIHHM